MLKVIQSNVKYLDHGFSKSMQFVGGNLRYCEFWLGEKNVFEISDIFILHHTFALIWKYNLYSSIFQNHSSDFDQENTTDCHFAVYRFLCNKTSYLLSYFEPSSHLATKHLDSEFSIADSDKVDLQHCPLTIICQSVCRRKLINQTRV